MFNSMLTFANQVGFKSSFKSFYNLQRNDISKADTIFITIDGSFLKNYLDIRLQKKEITHPILQRIFGIITALSQESNKVIAILLPDIGIANNALNALLLEELCTVFRITQPGNEAVIKSNLGIFLYEMLQPDHVKSSSYNTALLHKKDTKQPNATNLEIKNECNDIVLKTVPTFKENNLIKTFPLALYIKNSTTRNQFFIAKTGLLTFADIKEHFTYNPIDYPNRAILLSQLQGLLQEIYDATNHQALLPTNHGSLQLPAIFTQEHAIVLKDRFKKQRNNATDQKKYTWIIKDEIWCGWGGLEPYENKETQAAQNLFKSGINLLWLELNPEWYLADNAIMKDKKEKFLQSIKDFNKALSEVKQITSLTPPHYFVGSDITSNYSSANVIHPVKDVYGLEYSKIPSPFDFDNFWQKELLEVYSRFKSAWQESNHSIPIEGIFLDFEMYHAQTQSGQYTAIMDFSDFAWKRYAQAKNRCYLLALSFENRIRYLLDKQLFDDYFDFLKHEAFSIGKKIKQFFDKEFPQALIAAYNIHLPHSWFYLGILAGLSSPQDPIILATFNNEFYRHYHWLHNQNIFMYHLPVLLFSKLQTKEDFNLIDDFAKTHDGVWFNRISRLEEPRDPKEWKWDYGLETSPLPTHLVVEEINKHITEVQKNLR